MAGEKILVIFRWITFAEKQHMSYFWHVLTEGGNCLNFINTNQNSFPELARPHRGNTSRCSCYRPKLLNEPKRATAPCDDWWAVGLIWSSHIVDCWSCIHGAEGGRLETICERLVVKKKKIRAKRLVGEERDWRWKRGLFERRKKRGEYFRKCLQFINLNTKYFRR